MGKNQEEKRFCLVWKKKIFTEIHEVKNFCSGFQIIKKINERFEIEWEIKKKIKKNQVCN